MICFDRRRHEHVTLVEVLLATLYRRQQCTRAGANVDNAPGRAGERKV